MYEHNLMFHTYWLFCQEHKYDQEQVGADSIGQFSHSVLFEQARGHGIQGTQPGSHCSVGGCPEPQGYSQGHSYSGFTNTQGDHLSRIFLTS